MYIKDITGVKEDIVDNLVLLGLDGLPIVRFIATCDDCGFVVSTPHDVDEAGDRYNDLIKSRSSYHTESTGHQKFSINHSTHNLLKCYVCDCNFPIVSVSEWGKMANDHYKDTNHAFYIACVNPDWK